jgi:hypothetical protein
MDDHMQNLVDPVPQAHEPKLLDGVSGVSLAATGIIEVAGHRYAAAERVAEMFGVTLRTLARWDNARIGPAKIKVGKLVLYDLSKVPEWLATRETGANRTPSQNR